MSAVFESGLPAWLKPYAAAFASFAADDGTRVYPTVKRIARMCSRSERRAQNATTELRRLGVLVVEAPSGRATAARYRFNASALPYAGVGSQFDLPFLFDVSPDAQANPYKRSAKSRFPQFPQQLTGRQRPGIPDASVGRSVSRSVKYSSYTRAKTKTGTEGA